MVVFVVGVQSFATQLKMSKDTFLRAINQKEISTSNADIGDEVRFIIQEPYYVGENVAISKGAVLVGEIEDLKMPVQGTNASMKLRFDWLVLDGGKAVPINAYVWSKNNNVIGQEQTPPMYYQKVAHYPFWSWGRPSGLMQYAPSGVNSFGTHTVIKAGAMMNIILTRDLIINN